MVWSSGEWQQKLESLVEKCAEKVLQDLEKEIIERLRNLGQGMIRDIIHAEGSTQLSAAQDSRDRIQNLTDQARKLPSNEDDVEAENSFIKPFKNIVWYGFAIIKDRAVIPDKLAGLDNAPLDIIREGKLGMLVCPVPAEEFCQEALHRHMEDLAWVENYALQHENVLLEHMTKESLLPLPFCTVFTDVQSIKSQLKDRSAFLESEIERTANHHEMCLKLFVNTGRIEKRIQEEMPYTGGQAGSGYFLKRQWEKEIQKQVEQITGNYGEPLFDRLTQIAKEYLTINQKDAEAKELSLVFGAYFLLSQELHREWELVLEEFDQTADQWGFIIETSGPWPPYHFTGLQKGEESGGGDSEIEAGYSLGSGGKIT